MIFMFFKIFITQKKCFELFSSSKELHFSKFPRYRVNREKSSYQVSVSLPGVGKIPVARKTPKSVLQNLKNKKIENSEP